MKKTVLRSGAGFTGLNIPSPGPPASISTPSHFWDGPKFYCSDSPQSKHFNALP